jgi:hypothetical protein
LRTGERKGVEETKDEIKEKRIKLSKYYPENSEKIPEDI